MTVLGAALASSAGCGGGQTQGAAFDATLPDDGASMSALQRRLASEAIPRAADVAVGVFGERSLVGVPLVGGTPWTFEHPIACRPVIAGDVVVGAGDNEMFGLDAKTGKLLWTRKVGGCLRGAADNGHVTVVSVRPITGFGGIVVAIDRDGHVVRQIEDDSRIGAPAVVGGIVFLPWAGRHVSAYDLSAGEEVARVRFTGRVTRAFTVGGALYFGEQTVTRFDERIALAPAGGAWTLSLPPRALPDRPAWMDPGDESAPPAPGPKTGSASTPGPRAARRPASGADATPRPTDARRWASTRRTEPSCGRTRTARASSAAPRTRAASRCATRTARSPSSTRRPAPSRAACRSASRSTPAWCRRTASPRRRPSRGLSATKLQM